MNNPEYILTDVFAEIATAIKAELALDVLNYQFGYITSLNQTLAQWAKMQDFAKLKFPCIWLQQPFTIARDINPQFYGKTRDLRIFIMTSTQVKLSPSDHMEQVFKPTLFPVYRELLRQMDFHLAFSTQSPDQIAHLKTDRYWWGADQQSEIVDVVDCVEILFTELLINNNQNCTTFSNL